MELLQIDEREHAVGEVKKKDNTLHNKIKEYGLRFTFLCPFYYLYPGEGWRFFEEHLIWSERKESRDPNYITNAVGIERGDAARRRRHELLRRIHDDPWEEEGGSIFKQEKEHGA